MALSSWKYPPNTVHLAGPVVEVNDLAAGVAITPGMLIDVYAPSAGVVKVRPHATAAGFCQKRVALNLSMLNKGVDDAYAIGDLVELGIGTNGSTFWMLIPSGQNISAGNFLESNGDGKLRVFGSGSRLFQALEDKNNSAGPGDARIRVEVV